MKTTFTLNNIEVSFFLILFGTALNGLFNSLAVAYGFTSYPLATFLFDVSDLHGDLVKLVLSFMQHDNIINFSDWSSLYQGYFQNNPYGGVESLKANSLTHMVAPPIMVNISLLFGKLILDTSPEFLVKIFYTITIGGILLISFWVCNVKKAFFIFLVMLLSYPILFILTRGHIFSFLSGMMLIFYFYLIVKKAPIIIPIILLALVTNFRPNAAVLSLLFLFYGFKDGLKGFILFCIVSLSVFYVNLLIAHHLYNDYTLENFIAAVKIYFQMYVLGNAGDAFNNSLFGCIKTLSVIFQIDITEKLKFINSLISFSFLALLGFALILFMKNKINRFELAFISALVYATASSVFATYHMFLFFAFLLIPLKNMEINYSPKYLNIILITSVFIIIPKNYYHVNVISIETILNPIAMSCAIGYILIKSFMDKSNKTDNDFAHYE